MIVVEIFLPLINGEYWGAGDGDFQEIRQQLVAKLGGLTMYSRSPHAAGIGPTTRSIGTISSSSRWLGFRTSIERRLRQKEVPVRAREGEKL